MSSLENDSPLEAAMAHALRLAARGEGLVEPNPMVGCVVLRDGEVVGEGWHERYGGPHAEVNALQAAGDRARGATVVVTLEPCRHQGKTPPCTRAILEAGVERVVIACRDPFPEVDGGGVAELQAAGVECVLGVCETDARQLLAPYLMLVEQGRPWVIAKWAMTLDGKLATRTGDSQWISGESSRAIVHRLRARVDAVSVGAGTLVADDPLLTARLPEGETALRSASRIVVAGDRPLPIERKLWSSTESGPVIVSVGEGFPRDSKEELEKRGVEVITAGAAGLLSELGKRHMTNVLVEGGAGLFGQLFDADLVDEVHAFVAPKIAGGAAAHSPIGGLGRGEMAEASPLKRSKIESLGEDLHVWGRLRD